MTEKERSTLLQIIRRFKQIANKEFDGKVYDNALNIFERLTLREKQILLKGLLNICFIMEDKMIVDNSAILEIKDVVTNYKKDIEDEIKDIEQFNAVELIKLKSWLVKTITITVLLSFIAFIGAAVFISNEGSVIPSAIESIFNVFKVIFTGK